MQVRQGRINFTNLAELPKGSPILSGTFSVHHIPANTLFDSGAKFGAKVGLEFCHTKRSYMISTTGGRIASNQIIKNVPIKLGNKLFKTDLILLELQDIDIILGMDWMNRHGAILDIAS